MSLVFDERAVSAAVIALFADTPLPIYPTDEVPGSNDNPPASSDAPPEETPPLFADLTVSRVHTPSNRFSGSTSQVTWRVLIRGVGRTVAEAQWAKNQISEVMDSATPVLAGATCTPMSFEADTAIGFVDGFQEGASSWTFTHA
jgi:hypothetical protein